MKKLSYGRKYIKAGILLGAMIAVMSSMGLNINAQGIGKVAAGTSNVRSTPSTSADKVTTVSEGTELTIEAQTTADDGKIWYKISVNGQSGYIRSDLLTGVSGDIPEEGQEAVGTEGQEPEVTGEPAVEEEAAAAEGNEANAEQEFDVKYEANAEGENEWFLYDYTRGTKQAISNIYAIMDRNQEIEDKGNSDLNALKIVCILLGVLSAILIVVIAILIFRLRDARSYGYEDDYDGDYDYDDGYGNYDGDYDEGYEEYEEEPYEEPARPRRAVKSEKAARSGRKSGGRYQDEFDYQDGEGMQEKSGRKSQGYGGAAPKPSRDGSRRGKGQVDELDEDMEFEFLDLE